jgi:GH15 family glucan-1,4-alpha-glucosidase
VTPADPPVRPAPLPARARSASLPIADYALLADGNGSALVARDGSIDWLCLPRFDSAAVFARLLGPDAGHWSIRPSEPASVSRRYVPGTLVAETTFATERGRVRLIDALAFAPGHREHDLGRSVPHELLRLVVGVEGTVELDVELAPRPEFGLVRPLIRTEGHLARTFGGPNRLAVAAGVPLALDGATLRARLVVTAGERAGFALRWAAAEDDPAAPPTPAADVAGRLDDVIAGWRSWEEAHDGYHGARRELVRLSSRVLMGLTYRPTGAIVAAPTTSLPETVGGERNWDYRFAWVRDASMTLQALYLGACPDEAVRFVSFMTSAAGGRTDHALQIMYGIGGEHDLAERTLAHLPGWRGSAPVRVGNGAWDQDQLDVYGQLLDAVHRFRGHLGELHPEIQRFVADLADAAAARWREPDAGMWEMRGEPRHHVSSKLMCWVALDRAVALAPGLGPHARPEAWAAARDEVRAVILDRGFSERRGAYAQALDTDELDAAALLMPLVGFLPADAPRMRATIEAVARELTDDGLVVRYRTSAGDNADGISGEEGTFVLCSFWLVSCLSLAGEHERAEALFDRLTGFANDVGLLAEEVDPRTGELLGNFPQAFSHIGLITAAEHLDRRSGT